MADHDAVDRLMALATEKRADRVADLPAATARAQGVLPDERSGELALEAQPSGASSSARPADAVPDLLIAKAGSRGRQIVQAVRPLLPAIAGAMRMIDHGAVQALARLLPLLGGPSAFSGAATAPSSDPSTDQQREQTSRALQALVEAQARYKDQVHSLELRQAALEDHLGRMRTQLERATAEQSAHTHQVRSLSDRVRLLSAATIILLMLVLAQIILLAIIFHK